MCSKRTQSVLDLDRSIATMQADDASRFVQRCWDPREQRSPVDHYTALAHAASASRAELPADMLLPGDAIELDGYVLTVEHVTVTSHLAIIAVAGFDWSRSLNRDRLVRLA
jgi:hypothetical protein